MRVTSAEAIAKIGIVVQFMALVRCLLEYLRLKSIYGAGLTIAAIEPFIVGSLIAAFGAWIAVICYFLRWYKTAIAVSGGTVVILLAYKIYLMC